MSVRKEVDDVIQAYTAASKDGHFTPDELHAIARESFDVLRIALVDGDDLGDVRDEVERALDLLVNKHLSNRPILRMMATKATGAIAEQILIAVSEYTGSAEDFLVANVDPILARWEETLHQFRAVLS